MGASAAITAVGFPRTSTGEKLPEIATVITEYRHNSHADVIVGRMLEGYDYLDAHQNPRVKVVSMYTDQVPQNDMSRDIANKHGYKIYPTIREALTLGGDSLAVNGVVLIGEHGNYQWNAKGQHLYPRYELYQAITDVFRKTGQSAPVFADKHLSYDWEKARWMYDQSRELGFPLMAGSSLPVACRIPQLEIETGTRIDRAVAVFYGGQESYGFHALECLQCMAERRAGGETGITAVRCLAGEEVWNWTDANPWAAPLLEACLSQCPERKDGALREVVKEPFVFLIDYTDGLAAAVYRLNGCINSFAFAADIAGVTEPISCRFYLTLDGTRAHFSGLVHHIESMMLNNRTPYPVERTLLTTGALAAIMDSSYENGKKIETPHLAIKYTPPEPFLFNPAVVPPGTPE